MKTRLNYLDFCNSIYELASPTIKFGVSKDGVGKSGLPKFRISFTDTVHKTTGEVFYECDGVTMFGKKLIVELDVLIAMIKQAIRERVVASERKRIKDQIGALDDMYTVDCCNIEFNDSDKIEAPVGIGMVRSNLNIAAIILRNSDGQGPRSVDYRNYVVASFRNENLNLGMVDCESFASYYTYSDWYDHVYLKSPLERQRKMEKYAKEAEKAGVGILMSEINGVK